MKANGSASAGMNAPDANLSLNTTVLGSGASTLSTITKYDWRALDTLSGGWMMRAQLAATSAAVRAEPSWNLTPSCSFKVEVLPSSLVFGISVHRSHVKSVDEPGLSGLTRIIKL